MKTVVKGTLSFLLEARSKIKRVIKIAQNKDCLLYTSSRDVKPDDALLVVMSRRNFPSYSRQMALIPAYMNKYFQMNNCVLIYPVQMGIGEEETGTFRSISTVHHGEGEDLALSLIHI